MIVDFTEEELNDMVFGMGSPGVCSNCGYWEEYAGCEPDAHNYSCPECGEDKLCGLEYAIAEGYVGVKG